MFRGKGDGFARKRAAPSRPHAAASVASRPAQRPSARHRGALAAACCCLCSFAPGAAPWASARQRAALAAACCCR